MLPVNILLAWLAAAVAAAPSVVIQGDHKIGPFAVQRDGTLGGLISAFGDPSSIRRKGFVCYTRWRPLGLNVTFYNLGGQNPCARRTGHFSQAVLTGTQWRTSLGLRVGDSLERMRRLFPRGRARCLVVADHAQASDRRLPGVERKGRARPGHRSRRPLSGRRRVAAALDRSTTVDILIVVDMRELTLLPIACCQRLAAPSFSEEEAEATATLFRALGDPARVKILNVLATCGEAVCACEFEPALGLAQPTVSHHLKKLTDAGLLEREQRGKWAYFAIRPEAIERLAGLVDLQEVRA